MTAPPLYRPNVGAMLFNPAGRVFVGRRAHHRHDTPPFHAWQLPQGGIDAGEAPRTAVLRELAEETGVTNATILAQHEDWLTYDLPPELARIAFRGRYRGQCQLWFALRHHGTDADIRLDAHGQPEFDAWRWAALDEIVNLAVPFKRTIYATVVQSFARFAAT